MTGPDSPSTRPVDTYPCCRICQQNVRAAAERAIPDGTEHVEQTRGGRTTHANQPGAAMGGGHAGAGGGGNGESEHGGHGLTEPGRPEESEHDGHGVHTDHSGHEHLFRKRFWVCLVLSIPVVVYSEFVQATLGYTVPPFPGSELIPPVLSVVVFAYGGVPFLSMARTEVRNRKPGMMLLVSLAITVAFSYSLATMVLPGTMPFFWELVTLIDVMLLGHWIEMRSVRRASGALDELARLMPDTAERLTESGETETVGVSELQSGDVVLVRPGASIPADGDVVEGESSVDESMITGESKPVDKEPGTEVVAGTINSDGSLRVEVTATGDETALAGIMRLVTEAQSSKSETQLLADRAAGWLFYVALAVAALTAIGWTVAQGFDIVVLERVVTVLVVACPHALGLAIPLVVAINTATAAENGILVRDRIAMEAARDLDVVVFDKTGTLTRGEQGVVDVETAGDDWDEDRALAVAAGVEGDSEHMIARAIRDAAANAGVNPVTPRSFENLRGRGVRATVDDQTVHVGGPNLLLSLDVEPPTHIREFAQRAGENAQTVVYLVRNGSEVVAAFALADVVREESQAAVEALHDLGIEVAMLTGDSKAVASAVARELGIDQYFAEVLPDEKDAKIASLQEGGSIVAMVGDGVNDAPALTRADVGIAIGSGTDVAVEAGDIVLVENDPMDVVRLVRLSRASYRKMQENLVWATGYNIFALPLAAGVLAPIGFLLSPAVGAAFMSASTVIVAVNARRLRGVDLSIPGRLRG